MEWFVSYASISSFPMVWFSRIIHVLMVVAICDFTPHSEIILFLNLLQFSTLIFDDLYGFGGFKLLLSEWCVHLCTNFICPRRELIAGYICRRCAPRLLTGFHCCTFTNHLLVPDTIYFRLWLQCAFSWWPKGLGIFACVVAVWNLFEVQNRLFALSLLLSYLF